MVKEVVKTDNKPALNVDAILNKARGVFGKSEKGLGLQITTASSVVRPNKDGDFICWPDSSWQIMTGIRGIPFGIIVQIAGRPDSGKSTHAMEFMVRAQKQGHIVILWDAEKKFSAKRYRDKFGGNPDEVILITNKMISEGGDIVDAVVHATMATHPNKKIFLVWDSVGGTLPQSEKDKAKRDSRQAAEQAKESGRVVRGFVQLMEQYKNKETNEDRIAVLLINQTYANLKGPGQIESGGQKVEYHSSLIIQLTRKADLFKVREGIKRKVGISTRARVKKNHLFEGEDAIAEMILDIKANGVFVNKKDPSYKLVSSSQQQIDDLEEEQDDNEEEFGDEKGE